MGVAATGSDPPDGPAPAVATVPAAREDDGWEVIEGGADSPSRRVLMLPANMATAEFFRDMVTDPALAAAGVRAVAATPPGFGGVPAPPGYDFTVESYAGLIDERAIAGGFDLVVGHSLSANALVEVAARGRYEGGLVLVAPTLRASSEERAARIFDKISRLPLLGPAAWFGMMLGLGFGMRPELAAERRGPLVAEMRRNPARLHRRWLIATFDHLAAHDPTGGGDDDGRGDGDGGGLAAVLAGAAGAGRRARLVRGSEDPVALHPDDRATLDAAGVEIVEIPDARHFVVARRPHAVNQVVLGALADLDA